MTAVLIFHQKEAIETCRSEYILIQYTFYKYVYTATNIGARDKIILNLIKFAL